MRRHKISGDTIVLQAQKPRHMAAMYENRQNPDAEDTDDWTESLPTFGFRSLSGNTSEITAESLLGSTIVDRYEVHELVGQGGFSLVFRGWDTEVQRDVAIKIPRYPGEPAARVARGGRLSGQLDHHFIASLFDAGVFQKGEHQIPFLIMELVSGARLLTDYCKAEGLSLDERLQMFVKVCDAVAAAHAEGVVHRDLKPGNILINESGEPRVIDFDTASRRQVVDERTAMGAPNDGIRPPPPTADRSTGIVGTALYMSPEQWRGDKAEPASDVFAMGIILCELSCDADLTAPVVRGTTAKETSGSLLRELEKSAQFKRILPRPIRRICHCCLESDLAARYQDAAALAVDLRTAIGRLQSRRRTFGLAAVAAVSILIVAGLFGPQLIKQWQRRSYVEAVRTAATIYNSPKQQGGDLTTSLADADRRWRAFRPSEQLPSELTLLRTLGIGRQTEIAWAVTGAVFDSSGDWLVGVGRLGNIVLSAADRPEAPIFRLQENDRPITTLYCGPKQQVISVDSGGELKRWLLSDVRRDTGFQSLAELPPEKPSAVAVSPDASLLAAASGQTVMLWEFASDADAAAGSLVQMPHLELAANSAASVRSLCFDSEPSRLFVGMTDGKVLSVNRQSGVVQSQTDLGVTKAVELRRSRDGERVVAFAAGGPLQLFIPEAENAFNAVTSIPEQCDDAVFTDAGTRLLLLKRPTGGADQSTLVRVFDITTPQQLDFLCELQVPEKIRDLDIANGRVCLATVDAGVQVANAISP